MASKMFATMSTEQELACAWYRRAMKEPPSADDREELLAVGIAIGIALSRLEPGGPNVRAAPGVPLADALHYVAQGLAHGVPAAADDELVEALLDARDTWIAAWRADQ